MDDEVQRDLELPRGIALAWGIASSPQRGPKREMSVERIVDAAVRIADERGLSAVSMSGVANSLGYTPMSLYRYISAKDDLLVLMFEAGVRRPPAAAAQATSWREALTRLYVAQCEIFERHPWLLDISVAGVNETPNNLAWLDAWLHALAGLPLGDDERLAAALLVTGHVRWQATVNRTFSQAETDGRDWQAAALTMESLISPDAFPDLYLVMRSGAFWADSDPFTWGLQRILDGIEAVVSARPGSRPAEEPQAAPPQD